MEYPLFSMSLTSSSFFFFIWIFPDKYYPLLPEHLVRIVKQWYFKLLLCTIITLHLQIWFNRKESSETCSYIRNSSKLYYNEQCSWSSFYRFQCTSFSFCCFISSLLAKFQSYWKCCKISLASRTYNICYRMGKLLHIMKKWSNFFICSNHNTV